MDKNGDSMEKEENLRAAESFVTQLEALVEDGAYKRLRRVVDENQKARQDNASLQAANWENIRTLAQLQQQVYEKNALLEKERNSTKVVQAERDSLRSELGEVRKNLKEERSKAIQTIGERQGALEDTTRVVAELLAGAKKKDDVINGVRDELRVEREKTRGLMQSGQEMRMELDKTQKALQASVERIGQLEKFASRMDSPSRERICQYLHNIFTAAYDLATCFFGVDLERHVLEDAAALETMRNHSLVKRAIPLPLSNSPAARQMRVAASLAIIGDSLAQYILQPTYLLRDSNELSDLLGGLSMQDAARESYVRAVLLSVSPDRQEQNRRARCNLAANDVLSYMASLLPSPDRLDDLRAALEAMCDQVSAEWAHVQALADRVETSFDTYEGHEWRSLAFGGGGAGGGEATGERRSNMTATLSPRTRSVVSPKLMTAESPARSESSLMRDDVHAAVWPAFVVFRESATEVVERGFALTEAQTRAAQDEEVAGQGKRRAARAAVRRAHARTATVNGDEADSSRRASFLSRSVAGVRDT